MSRPVWKGSEKMVLRKIVKIDEEKCDGCGLCIPNCVEGALQIVDGKARLVKEEYCDGLGACLGKCPQGAVTIEEKESEAFDKTAVEDYLKKEQAINTSSSRESSIKRDIGEEAITKAPVTIESALTHWPIQIMLVPSRASFLDGADLLITADCVPFCYANYHRDFLKGKTLLVGCPKFDDIKFYQEKLKLIFQQSNVRSVTVVNMEVPCCFGLYQMVKEALVASGKNIPLDQEIISVKGKRLPPQALRGFPFAQHM